MTTPPPHSQVVPAPANSIAIQQPVNNHRSRRLRALQPAPPEPSGSDLDFRALQDHAHQFTHDVIECNPSSDPTRHQRAFKNLASKAAASLETAHIRSIVPHIGLQVGKISKANRYLLQEPSVRQQMNRTKRASDYERAVAKLSEAWGGDSWLPPDIRKWLPEPYDRGILRALVGITKLTPVDALEQLWQPGGILHDVSNRSDPPKLSREGALEAYKLTHDQFVSDKDRATEDRNTTERDSPAAHDSHESDHNDEPPGTALNDTSYRVASPRPRPRLRLSSIPEVDSRICSPESRSTFRQPLKPISSNINMRKRQRSTSASSIMSKRRPIDDAEQSRQEEEEVEQGRRHPPPPSMAMPSQADVSDLDCSDLGGFLDHDTDSLADDESIYLLPIDVNNKPTRASAQLSTPAPIDDDIDGAERETRDVATDGAMLASNTPQADGESTKHSQQSLHRLMPDAELARKMARQLSNNVCLTDDVVWVICQHLASLYITTKPDCGNVILDTLVFQVDQPIQSWARAQLPTLRPDCDVYVPVHHASSSHWSLMRLVWGTRYIVAELFDSLSLEHAHRCRRIEQTCPQWLKRLGFNQEVLVSSKPCPQQTDITSCGVFVLAFIATLLQDQPLPQAIDPKEWRQYFLSLLLQKSQESAQRPSSEQAQQRSNKALDGGLSKPAKERLPEECEELRPTKVSDGIDALLRQLEQASKTKTEAQNALVKAQSNVRATSQAVLQLEAQLAELQDMEAFYRVLSRHGPEKLRRLLDKEDGG